MEFPRYDATCHPNEYVKKMRTYCKIHRINNEQEILELCKLTIDSTINLPNNINSFNGLIAALKSHVSFTIFTNSCKSKLNLMKYIPEKDGGNTAIFLSNFRSLCNDTEINYPEVKRILYNKYSNNFFKEEFSKESKNLYSVGEVLKLFSDIIYDEPRLIRYGSCVALRHVVSGKYLSSCNKCQIVGIEFFFFNFI